MMDITDLLPSKISFFDLVGSNNFMPLILNRFFHLMLSWLAV
jgi:hypothetical protein